MSFKLSQTTKDFFDVIRTISSYISITAVGISIILFTIDDEWLPNFFKNHKIWAYILGFSILIAPLVIPYIHKKVNLYILKRRKLSSIIIERQDILIDIIDDGKTASYYERVCFFKLQKKNSLYVTKLEVSGYIDSQNIHTLNCSYNLNSDKKKLIISYINNTDRSSNYSSLLKSDEKSLTYSAVLKDTFVLEEETWVLHPTNYCISFNLSMLMPKGKTILYVKISRTVDKITTDLDDIQPIVVTEHDRHKIIVQIVDYDYGDYLTIKWKLT